MMRYTSSDNGEYAYTNIRRIMDHLPKSKIVELTFTDGVANCNHNYGFASKDHYVSFCVPTAAQFIITGCYNIDGITTKIYAVNFNPSTGLISTLNGNFWVSFMAHDVS